MAVQILRPEPLDVFRPLQKEKTKTDNGLNALFTDWVGAMPTDENDMNSNLLVLALSEVIRDSINKNSRLTSYKKYTLPW